MAHIEKHQINIKDFHFAVELYLDNSRLKQMLLTCRLTDGIDRTLTEEEVEGLIEAVRFFSKKTEKEDLGVVNLKNKARVKKLLKFLRNNH